MRETRGQKLDVRDQKLKICYHPLIAYCLQPNAKQRSEIRGQRSEVRGQMSEVRGQRSEVRGQMSDIRGQM